MTTSHTHDAVVERDRPKQRDAARTRLLLLQTALRLFAANGYAATTVREIAQEAGVNVALISRYFESKEGLFEACLTDGSRQIRTAVGDAGDAETLAQTIATQLLGVGREPLMLLLRSSGDEKAESIRLGVLRSVSERIAALAGWRPGGDDETLLRAQVLLSTLIGIAVLRARADGPQPLASATELDLRGPLDDVVQALLRIGTQDGHGGAARG